MNNEELNGSLLDAMKAKGITETQILDLLHSIGMRSYDRSLFIFAPGIREKVLDAIKLCSGAEDLVFNF
jgi:hypothetical protein